MASRIPRLPLLSLALLALFAGATTRAQDAVLLYDGSGGDLELEGENRLVISELQGTFALRLGREGSLVYGARDQKNRRQELPVALWLEGSELRFGPLDEADTTPVFMEIAVPPGLDVEIEVQASHVSLSGLLSKVRVEGSGLEVRAGGMDESVRLRIEGGSVRLEGLSGDVELEGRDLDVFMRQIAGQVDLTLASSKIELDNVAGALVASLDESTLVAEELQNPVSVAADGGSVTLNGARRGAELRLGATPLTLNDVALGVRVETEADVEFRDLKSDLEMTSYGGSLRGQGNSGGVHVSTDGATVILEGIAGDVTVEGRELRVHLRDVRNQVRVVTTMSSVSLQSAGGTTEIENDFGDVDVKGATGPLKIVNRDGAVRILELMGALDLTSDGPEVQVSWARVPADLDSSVKNERGDVSVGLPPQAQCRVEAIARFGGVRSDLPEVRVSDDGKYANGVMGGAEKPVISIDSGGAVYIGSSRSEPDP